MNKSKIAFYRKRFCDELEGILKQGSSVYINGQFGCGKTTAIREWKEKKEPNALWLDGENADFAEKIRRASGGKIIVDDIHKLNATQIEAVVQRIKKNGTQFIFIGCAQLPPWLKQLFLNWKLEVMGAEKLVMDVEEIETILMTNRINFNIEIVHEIQEETKGYPMAVSLLVHYMAEGRNLDEVLKKQVKKDMLDIFEREISVKFDKELKEVLWCMVWFHAFSTELANFVCENQDKESWLTKLQKIPYFFVEQEGTWTWIPAYRQFFMKKQSDESREIRKKQSCNRGGLYYESKGEFVRALYYYHEAENEEKVSKILLQDSQNYAGVGRF
ncbi:MAG: ATP-binding protein, partial [Acetivibrio sp.]